MRRLRFLSALLLALAGLPAQAQSYSLRLHPVGGEDSALLIAAAKPPASFASGESVRTYLRNLIPELQESGLLAASLDSLTIDKGGYDAFIYIGDAYRWVNLSFDALPPALLANAGIAPTTYASQHLKPKQLSRLSEKILVWCEDNGYPFARVYLDSIEIGKDTLRVSGNGGVPGGKAQGISATLMLDKGLLRHIDSIQLEGTARISPDYLSRYLDLYEADIYSEKKLRTLSTRIRELPFLQEAQPWSIAFKLYDTRLKLNLKEKKANQINALVGLLPNSQATGKFLLTVDALFAFQNILTHGESLSFSYQNLQYKSPRLKADVIWPYLFDTPFGAEGHFDLYKKDTAFRRTTLQLGTRYQINAADYLRIFYENQSNRLITIDTQFVRINRRLPENVDVSANGAGVELQLNRTDYRLNPRKGYTARVSATALLRKITRADAIADIQDGSGFNYGSLYDTLEQRRYQYRLSADAAYYQPLAKRLVLRAAYSGGYISGNNLFQNELYQIGGFRLLRGFDEQSIYTNHYHLVSLELRLLFAGNSNVYLFSDNAWVQTHFIGLRREGIYNGFGIGTTLETKTGIFTLSLGLGRSEQNPLQFRQSKIHFGYVAYF